MLQKYKFFDSKKVKKQGGNSFLLAKEDQVCGARCVIVQATLFCQNQKIAL